MLILILIAATKSTSRDKVTNGANSNSSSCPKLIYAQLIAKHYIASTAREKAQAKAFKAKKKAQVKAARAINIAKSALLFYIRKADMPYIACASKIAYKDRKVYYCFITLDSLSRCKHYLSLKHICQANKSSFLVDYTVGC